MHSIEPQDEKTRGPHLGKVTLFFLLMAGLLFVPLPLLGRNWRSYLDMLHAPLFALGTFVFYYAARRWLPKSEAKALLIVGVLFMLAGYLSEIFQGFIGRSQDMGDVLANCLGVLAGICWILRRQMTGRFARGGFASLAIVALSLGWLRPVGVLLDVVRQHEAFPMLASFEHPFEVKWWRPHQSLLARVQQEATDGESSLQINLMPGESRYSGAAYLDLVSDWSSYDFLLFDLTVLPPSGPRSGDSNGDLAPKLKLIVKVEDRVHNGHYYDRFHETLKLSPGKHSIRISLADIQQAPRDRSMDLRKIKLLQFFTIDLKEPRTFYVDNIRLE